MLRISTPARRKSPRSFWENAALPASPSRPSSEPREYEVEDLEPLKQLDKALYEQGLPHFVEILGFDKLVENLPVASPDKQPGAGLAELWKAAQAIDKERWDFLKPQLEGYGKLPGSKQLLDELARGLDALAGSDVMAELVKIVQDFRDRMSSVS